MSILVSVIVPVYNAEKFIEETIRSVIAQEYPHWELLLVDDGSTDRSALLIKKFSSDTRIKYIHQNNAGVSAARNAGIKQAQGNYLAFLDSDDVWLSNNLKEKVLYLETHSDCGLVHSDVELINEKSERSGKVNRGREGQVLENLLLWEGTTINAPSSVVVRKEVMESVGGFDESFSTAADQDLWFRIAAKYSVGNISKTLVLYREHQENMSANVSRMEADHNGVYQKAERNKLFKSFWFRQKCFSNLYLILAGSWWVNGNNKARALYFVMKSLLANPFNLFKLIKKIF